MKIFYNRLNYLYFFGRKKDCVRFSFNVTKFIHSVDLKFMNVAVSHFYFLHIFFLMSYRIYSTHVFSVSVTEA